jgi:hypothetical protein
MPGTRPGTTMERPMQGNRKMLWRYVFGASSFVGT